jgi:two-component system, NarL family, nitrate/nitrite response regulator NarL
MRRLFRTWIVKSSIRFPELNCATSQRGCLPRPAQVSDGFSGLQYFGGTGGYGRRRDTRIFKSIRVSPNTKVVAFTAASGVEAAIRALDAGANGYVRKGSSAQELIQAVEAVRHGETYITQSFANQVIAGLRNAPLRKVAAAAVRFSIREYQIVRLLLRGKTNRDIAIALRISEKTVKNYMTILMQKLNARNRLEVVIAAQAFSERELDDSNGSSLSQKSQLS